jgi:RNA-directed DNA polymerase
MREGSCSRKRRLARVNAGAPGVDGMTFAQIEKQGLEAYGWRDCAWNWSRRHTERPLGIPTIRDRVIQTAAKIVIEPIFEADFEDNAYGYRPARGGGGRGQGSAPAFMPGLC